MAVASFRAGIDLYFDPVSLVMLLVITFVGFLIHLYSSNTCAMTTVLAILRIHESLRCRDDHSGPGEQSSAAFSRLGGRRALQFSAHRLLVSGSGNVAAGARLSW